MEVLQCTVFAVGVQLTSVDCSVFEWGKKCGTLKPCRSTWSYSLFSQLLRWAGLFVLAGGGTALFSLSGDIVSGNRHMHGTFVADVVGYLCAGHSYAPS